jgi:trk system potassium uptake protein TrkH
MTPMASKAGEPTPLVDAFFTATSAVCVTGLVVVDTGTYWSVFGQLVILFLIQVGGLGFMTMATLIMLLLGKRITLRERLVIQEALNQVSLQGLVKLTRYIIFITLFIEGVAAFFLALRFARTMDIATAIYKGIFHSISAFCNAGFDIMGDYNSLTGYTEDIVVNIVVIIAIILGGLGFSVLADLIQHKKFKKFSLHTKMVLTISAVLIILGFLVFFVLEYNNPETIGNLSFKGKVMGAFFHSVTARTAGFNTIPTDNLTKASKFFNIVLMFIGGSPGSTAGGIKTVTFGVLVVAVVSIIKGKEEPEIFKRRIPNEIVYRALAVGSVALFLVVFVTMVLSITEPNISFMDVFFESTSAFGTVGLSMGITPGLSKISRIVVTMTMFAGRVGPLTFALAMAQKQRKSLYKHPEEKVMVG